MILTPHMMVGAAVGSRFNNPRWIAILIVFALISHYLLDSIPHSEYQVLALANGLNWEFVIAALKVALDFFVGLIIIIFLCHRKANFYYILIGSIIGLLPDFLIFISWQVKNLGWLNNFVSLNNFFHYPTNRPVALVLGLTTQIIVSTIAVYFLWRTPKIRTKS
jgi:hypothetical protein